MKGKVYNFPSVSYKQQSGAHKNIETGKTDLEQIVFAQDEDGEFCPLSPALRHGDTLGRDLLLSSRNRGMISPR